MKKALPVLLMLLLLMFLSACGEQASPVTPEPPPPHVHSYQRETVKEVSCLEDGETAFRCACGVSYTELTPAEGHRWDATVIKEGSCLEDGETAYRCACGASYTELTPAEGHRWDATVIKEGSCLEDGETAYRCACGASYTELTPAAGHQWSDYTVIKEPTYQQTGEQAIVCTACDEVKESRAMDKKPLRLLFIGNSFAIDTSNLAPDMARDLGVETMTFGTLYIGGCSINRHYSNILENKAAYTYYLNEGTEWKTYPNYSIKQAIESTAWDFICIQHGTGDGSRYTDAASYTNLGKLVACVKDLAGDDATVAFNMAWVMEPDSTRPEMIYYNGNQLLMYENLTKTTQACVETVEGIDYVIPTGTAVQNARTVATRLLTRDTFHLSKDLGRYLASMTLLEGLCGIETDGLEWRVSGVSTEEREMVKKAVDDAILTPYAITNQKK